MYVWVYMKEHLDVQHNGRNTEQAERLDNPPDTAELHANNLQSCEVVILTHLWSLDCL